MDKFIEIYNDSATEPIVNITEMDIQGNDYKTEFRLNAFENAVGKKGEILDSLIYIVNYGSITNDSIRIYITVPNYDIATDIYKTTINIFDNSISEDEMMNKIDSTSIYLGETGFITGYVNDKYADGSLIGYEIMLDSTKIKFMDYQ